MSTNKTQASGHKPVPKNKGRSAWATVGGKKCFFRSGWEKNYSTYLQWLKESGEIIDWEHEPQTFWFEAIKRGVRSYLPDYRVTQKNKDTGEIEVVFHEVKGYMDPKSKTKLKRMRIYHPTVKMKLIDGPIYRDIAKRLSKSIPGWE